MADDTRTATRTDGVGLLTPMSRAVAGLALAVSGLMGQNIVAAALQIALIGDGGGFGGPIPYAVGTGLGAAVPALLALALVLPQARADGDLWTSHLSRAAVVLSAVVLVGAVLTVIAALVRS